MTVDWSLNLANIVTFVGGAITLVIAWVKISERSQNNLDRINGLKNDIDRRFEEHKHEMGERVRSIHARYDQYQAEIAESMRSIASDVKAIVKDISQHREQVAQNHPTRAELSELIAGLRQDIKELAARFGRR